MTLLMRPEPFSREVDRLFDAFFGHQADSRRWVPAMDLIERDDHFLLKADLPGLAEDDVAVEIRDGVLTISGSRASEHEATEDGWYRIERASGAFSRTLTLPEGVDADGVTAEFDRGVLSVRIPKPEERKPRRIEIATRNGAPPAVEGTAEEKSSEAKD